MSVSKLLGGHWWPWVSQASAQRVLEVQALNPRRPTGHSCHVLSILNLHASSTYTPPPSTFSTGEILPYSSIHLCYFFALGLKEKISACHFGLLNHSLQ